MKQKAAGAVRDGVFFVVMGLWWGIMDGAFGGAVLGVIVGVVSGGALNGALLGAAVGAVLGLLVGSPFGLATGATVAGFVACEIARNTSAAVIARRLPAFVTGTTVVLSVAVLSVAPSMRAGDTWFVSLGAAALAVALGRWSAYACARWYVASRGPAPA